MADGHAYSTGYLHGLGQVGRGGGEVVPTRKQRSVRTLPCYPVSGVPIQGSVVVEVCCVT